jgi:hypothetical protein
MQMPVVSAKNFILMFAQTQWLVLATAIITPIVEHSRLYTLANAIINCIV